MDPTRNPCDISVHVNDVPPEKLSHVWGVLSRIAEGLALDGFNVSEFLDFDRGHDPFDDDLTPAGPADEVSDQ